VKTNGSTLPIGLVKPKDLSVFRGRRGFRRYRRQAVACAQAILRQGSPGEFDEQALPAYTHRNRLMRWLFWKRLQRVLGFLDRSVPAGRNVLDFGCGVGVLLPLLAARGHVLTGIDVDLRLTPQYLNAFGVEHVHLCDAGRLNKLSPGSFDLITALDVLEHVEDLEGTIDQLANLLRPGGAILVCGPTENILYRVGRWLAGFSGAYHVRDIASIQRAFETCFHITTVATLFPLVPFFRVFVARPKTIAA
jgi:2-polyprenyl-3-methyl-5-hydroxy-6-metoxy-1,4-benzoquinol methylase